MKNISIAFFLIFLGFSSMANKNFESNCDRSDYIVLNYRDFGAEVAAYELLGMEIWQWQQFQTNPQEKFDIKVVVFRGMSEIKIKSLFPVDQDKRMDYRHISYGSAMGYLNNTIKENSYPPGMQQLKNTREILYKKFYCK